MKTVKVSLNSIDKVKTFVNDINRYDFDFDLVSGRYVIDAKSIMGIFSLDLSRPIDLNIHADEALLGEVLAAREPYIIESAPVLCSGEPVAAASDFTTTPSGEDSSHSCSSRPAVSGWPFSASQSLSAIRTCLIRVSTKSLKPDYR